MSYYRKGFNKKGEKFYVIEVKYFDESLKKYRCKSKRIYPPIELTNNKLIYFVENAAKDFEKKVKNVLESNNSEAIDSINIKFEDYANEWLEREKRFKGITYYEDHARMVKYLVEKLGQYKLTDLNARIIQNLFDIIDDRKKVITNITSKDNFMDLLLEKGWTCKKIKDNHKGYRTFRNIMEDRNITEEKAIEFSNVVSIDVNKLFIVKKNIFHTHMKQI